jgi:hypothetical protein
MQPSVLAPHPYALSSCSLTRVVLAQMTHLIAIAFIQEHETVRAEFFVYGDAGSADVEKTHGALPFAREGPGNDGAPPRHDPLAVDALAPSVFCGVGVPHSPTLDAAEPKRMRGNFPCRWPGVGRRKGRFDPSPDQLSKPLIASSAQAAIEESADPILHFGRDILVSQQANRLDGLPVGVQEGDPLGAAIQMLLERQG